MASSSRSRIYVLAGVNGAGKSSIGGAVFRAAGADYYDPDEAARAFMKGNPALSQADASSAAWHEGVKLLKRAIAERKNFVLETTLGANTIPRLLAEAAAQGVELYIWYVGLPSPELHIERVRARVRRGGHDIAAEHIYRRFEHSRLNLIELMPHLTALRVYDNSANADPETGKTPKPKLVLHIVDGKIRNPQDLKHTPDWAKPIVATALKLHQR